MRIHISAICIILTIGATNFCFRSSAQQSPPLTTETTTQSNATTLLQDFTNSKYFWQQAEVGEKLVALHDKSVIPAMVALLQSANREERTNAGRVLAGLGDDRGLFAVIAEVKDKSPRPTKMTDDAGRPYVTGQIQQDRYYATGVLGKLGDKRAETTLVTLLNDPKLDYQGAYALGQLDDKRAIPALRLKRAQLQNAIKSQPKSVRNYKFSLFAVSTALAQLGETQGMAELTGYLKDKEWIYRRYAVESLADFSAAKAVHLLTPMLQDPSERVRISAAQSLGKIGNTTAIPALLLAETPDDAHISWRTIALSNAAGEAISAIWHKNGIIGMTTDHGVITSYSYAPSVKPKDPQK